VTRDAERLTHLKEYIDDVFVGQVTDPDSVLSVCKDIEYVISTVGITRQKDGFTYMDVDYQGNRNLLDSALSNEVSKFIYVSVFNAHLMPNLKIIQAKERFVSELEQSSLDYTIIRPTGFYSDMLEILKMAKKGKVSLFGTGDYKINPIHGQDLAKVCLEAFEKTDIEVEVGGPETFTHREIAKMAFDVLGKKAKISLMPLWMKNMILRLLRLFTSSKTYGPVEFLLTALSMDGVAPAYGKEKLRDFFEANV
jgi:uncharacterized protein YbjT (DUF2867 family)